MLNYYPDQRLKRLLKQRGIRQLELAYLLEIHPSYLSLVANGWRTPPKELQHKIASTLKVQVEEIFGGNGR